jgi:hypothetical protein
MAPTDPRAALARLRQPGVASRFAAAHDLDLIVAFGSAVLPHGRPDDLDLGVRSRRAIDVLALLDGLYRVTGFEDVDVLDLRRAGPVARCEALDHGTVLYESEPGLFAAAHMAAVAQRADTAWLRRMMLDSLAS